MAKRGLGRGLEALLSDNESEPIPSAAQGSPLTELHLSDIEPNRGQARKKFNQEALEELASSIAQHGLLEPIVVRPKENGYYEIVAGERRWRASRMAGLSSVPVVIKELNDQDAALLSLIENLQREDLNPVEAAIGYRDLIDRFQLTQEEAAEKVGKSRSEVANLLRILSLPSSVLDLVRDGKLSYGHARAILPLKEKMTDEQLLSWVLLRIDENVSVRQMERLVKDYKEKKPQQELTDPVLSDYYKKLERRISAAAERKVSIQRGSNGKGKLVLNFSSSEDLETLIQSLCGNDFFNED